jgi:dienelactone hydrolase
LRFSRPRTRILLGLFVILGATGQRSAPSTSFVKLPDADGGVISGYLAKPATGSHLPGVLLVPGTSSLTGRLLETTRDLAAHGFAVLAVDYDPEQVSQQSDLVQSVASEQLSRRLTSAVAWLTQQRPLVDPHRIAVIGWEKGSARVLALAQQDQVQAGVMIAEEPCRIPQNLPAGPAARILLIIGGCAPEKVQDLKRDFEPARSAYEIGVFEAPLESLPHPAKAVQAWKEIYRFLDQTNDSSGIAQKSPIPSSSSVATIRDIMRVIYSDDGVRGRLAGLLATPSSAGAGWDEARSPAAILVQSCEWLLAQRPPRGSLASWRSRVADFRTATQTLLLAVEQHDLPGAQQALAQLPQSCAACHTDHR